MPILKRPTTDRPHICPWWLVHAFDNPLRRLVQNPDHILGDLVRPGYRCADIGCGIGYFTIPMARLAGPTGTVTAVDLQPQMLAGVAGRADKTGLRDNIHLQQADASTLNLEGPFDFALAFWMVHEVPDRAGLLRQIRVALQPNGSLLLVEPKAHVPKKEYAATIALAQRLGFVPERDVPVALSRGVLLR